jgi:murein DD-endopeptidase MepM/ murein hydrolase activator NlpD
MQFSKVQFYGFALLALVLAACAPAAIVPEAMPTIKVVIVESSPSQTLSPASTATPATIATILPAVSILQPLLCSPLAVQPLETLAEIVTQPFIVPRQLDDGSYKDDAHHGLDLGYYTRDGELFTGTPVLSATSGRVAALIYDRPPYGNAVLVETPYEQIPVHAIENLQISEGASLYVLYAHLQNLLTFNLKQEITCGQQLAETGLTGFTGGPHLHFETRWGPAGQAFDSMAYYRVETTEEERANYVLWRMSGTYRLFDPMILLSPTPEN